MLDLVARIINSFLILRIKADGDTLHKIGVTQRSIEQRLVKIQHDLKQHFKGVAIEVLGTWSHRGNVEKYFKYCYKLFSYPIGNLTEYYKFNSEDATTVLQDLFQMKFKELSEVETNPLSNELNQVELDVNKVRSRSVADSISPSSSQK